jgi:hypothetical protein
MHIIHNKIKGFWEKDGAFIRPRGSLQPEPKYSVLWDVCNKSGPDGPTYIEETIALTFYEDIPSFYYWQNAEYSEEEMLKIIKLSAFI